MALDENDIQAIRKIIGDESKELKSQVDRMSASARTGDNPSRKQSDLSIAPGARSAGGSSVNTDSKRPSGDRHPGPDEATSTTPDSSGRSQESGSQNDGDGSFMDAFKFAQQHAPKLQNNPWIMRQLAMAKSNEERKEFLDNIKSVIASTGLKAPDMGTNAEAIGAERPGYESAAQIKESAISAARELGRNRL